MNVISRRRLRAFYEAKAEWKLHAKAFDEWYKQARKASWDNFAELKQTFGQSDVVTGENRTATIFDVGGNKYRIVAHVDYERKIIKIEEVMDHKEYDKKKWLEKF